jgi:hypothetical protein
MDAPRFDWWTRTLTDTASRRSVLGLSGVALGLAATRFSGIATAKKKHKKKNPQKLTRNSFGCVDVGKACRGKDANCCSGICQGKKSKKGQKDTSKCAAHDVEGCQANPDGSLNEAEDHCPDKPAAWCYWTTGKGSFCGFGGAGMCVVCARDTDCEADFGAGAACIITDFCPNENATACTPRNLS